MNNKSYVPAASVFVLLIALLFKAFWPGISGESIALPGAYPDVYHFVWNAWFLRESFASNFSYNTTLVFWPTGTSLYLHTLTEGVLLPAVLLLPRMEPWRVYTLACLGCLALNCVSMFLLLKRISGIPAPSALLAAAFALHPFWYAHLDGGHLNMLAFFPIPLCLYLGMCMPRHLIASALVAILAGGFCIGLLPFTNLYYFYFAMLLLAAWCALALVWRNTHVVRYILGATTVGLCLAGVRLIATAKAGLSGEFSPNHDPVMNSLNLGHLLNPSVYQWIASLVDIKLAFPDAPNSSETAGYFGLVLLFLLGAFAIRRRTIEERMSVAAIGLLLALSLGPKVHIFSATPIWNPVFAALSWMPLFPSVPARFFCMALLAAMISLALWAKRSPRFITLVAAFLIVEWWPRPIHWQVVARSPLLERLRESSFGAIHDATHSPEQRMFHQVFHHKPITAAFLARRPRAAARELRKSKALSFLEGRAAADITQLSSSEFKELMIDGIIIPRNDSETIARAEKINGGTLADSDEQFLLYDVRK